MTENRSWK